MESFIYLERLLLLNAADGWWRLFFLVLCSLTVFLCCPSSLTNEPAEMDMSKLPKIRDEERESQFGYVHGVSGPGSLSRSPKMTRTKSIIHRAEAGN